MPILVRRDQLSRNSCRWSGVWAGCCPPTFGSAGSSARQRVSTRDSRRCAATTSTGSRPPPYGVEPHQARYITAWPRPLDVDAMTAASRNLLGLHDFAAFCRHREAATTIRDLQRLDWSRDGDLITAHVTADAFCWSMVRSLVGALLAVGEHRRTATWCRELLTSTRRSSDFAAAPARGLTLVGVDYPPDERTAGADADHPRPAHAGLSLATACRRRSWRPDPPARS